MHVETRKCEPTFLTNRGKGHPRTGKTPASAVEKKRQREDSNRQTPLVERGSDAGAKWRAKLHIKGKSKKGKKLTQSQ